MFAPFPRRQRYDIERVLSHSLSLQSRATAGLLLLQAQETRVYYNIFFYHIYFYLFLFSSRAINVEREKKYDDYSRRTIYNVGFGGTFGAKNRLEEYF